MRGCQALGEGNVKLVFNGDRVSVWENEKVVEMARANGGTAT